MATHPPASDSLGSSPLDAKSKNPVLRAGRKVVVAVIGGTVVLIGIALIVLPGPAIIVIPLGLAILGTEFLWARRLLQRFKTGSTRLFTRRRVRL